MTVDTIPQPTPPKQDVFRIFDDNSAIVESKHDIFYALRFFNLGGRYTVTDCECRGFYSRATCRHKEELEIVLETIPMTLETSIPYLHAAAKKAILAIWADAEFGHIEDDRYPCAACGGAVVALYIYSRWGEPTRYCLPGALKRVCECCGVAA